MLEIVARGEAHPYINQYGERLVVAMNAALREAGVDTGCVYGNGSIFHVLLVPKKALTASVTAVDKNP